MNSDTSETVFLRQVLYILKLPSYPDWMNQDWIDLGNLRIDIAIMNTYYLGISTLNIYTLSLFE